MSLLDWFAGQILGGLGQKELAYSSPEILAERAYTVARAMLAERAKER
ncbi:MAG: hypothetical protein ACRCTG_14485 [Aestuariivirga sp.]